MQSLAAATGRPATVKRGGSSHSIGPVANDRYGARTPTARIGHLPPDMTDSLPACGVHRRRYRCALDRAGGYPLRAARVLAHGQMPLQAACLTSVLHVCSCGPAPATGRVSCVCGFPLRHITARSAGSTFRQLGDHHNAELIDTGLTGGRVEWRIASAETRVGQAPGT